MLRRSMCEPGACIPLTLVLQEGKIHKGDGCSANANVGWVLSSAGCGVLADADRHAADSAGTSACSDGDVHAGRVT
jgi:hypothetical protein